MLNGMDDSTNDFSDEPPTVTEAYVSLADTAAIWREQIARSERPTVNIRPRQVVDAQAVTQPMAVVP